MFKYVLILIVCEIFIACKKDGENRPPQTSNIMLKDVVEELWPAPYYHFEYDDSGRVSLLSFASEYNKYTVMYTGNRVTEMRNTVSENKDRLRYTYNGEGKVELIEYFDSTGFVYKTVDLSDDGWRLVTLTHSRRSASGFVPEKTISMSYYDDGNVMDITNHLFPFDAVPGGTVVTHF